MLLPDKFPENNNKHKKESDISNLSGMLDDISDTSDLRDETSNIFDIENISEIQDDAVNLEGIYDINDAIDYACHITRIRHILYFMALSILLSIVLSIFGVFPLTTLRVIYGSIFVLFIPGYVATLAFFQGNDLDGVERAALSFGLSIALVPLSILVTNQVFGVRITAITCISTIMTLIALLLVMKLITMLLSDHSRTRC